VKIKKRLVRHDVDGIFLHSYNGGQGRYQQFSRLQSFVKGLLRNHITKNELGGERKGEME
jgi:hypothetical protein